MSLPVFIYPAPLTDHIRLSGAEGKHAVTVKRIRVGEQIALIDGTGTKATVTVTAIQGKDTLEGTVESTTFSPEPTPTVTIVQALPKAERSELTVDLLTQAGADHIVPWQAERCIAKWTSALKQTKGQQKWQAAAVAAAKQARRVRIPTIAEPSDTTGVEKLIATADCALVLHEEATESITTVPLVATGTLVIIIGPEGGLSNTEVTRFQQAGAQPVLLGPEVLRTATAGMAALVAVGMRTTRWGNNPQAG